MIAVLLGNLKMSIFDYTLQYGTDFLRRYNAEGFCTVSSVPVSSRVDPSVFLVGSTISVLKRFLLENREVPSCVLLQPAVRTQNLIKMEQGQYDNGIYGSFFLAMGTLAPYSALEDTTAIACQYLRSILPPDNSTLLFRVSSSDTDLLDISKNEGEMEIDSRPISYYRHKYGMDTQCILGRNFNIAVPTESGYKDVGNIIVIERNGKPFAVEFAMGMSTLLTHLFGLHHTMLGNIVADILPMSNALEYSLGDCLSVVACLQCEGVKPNASKMQGRILKRYIKVLNNLCVLLHKDPQSLLQSYSTYISGLTFLPYADANCQ